MLYLASIKATVRRMRMGRPKRERSQARKPAPGVRIGNVSIPYRFRLREKRRPGLRLRDFAVSPGIQTWQRRPGIVSRRIIAAVREAGVFVFRPRDWPGEFLLCLVFLSV